MALAGEPPVLVRTTPVSDHPGLLELGDDAVDQLLGVLGTVADDRGRHRVVQLAHVQHLHGPATGLGQLGGRRDRLTGVVGHVNREQDPLQHQAPPIGLAG